MKPLNSIVTAIPRVAVLQQANDSGEIVQLLARATRKLAAVYFPVYAFLMMVPHEFIAFLFTPRFLPGVPVFAINLTLLLPGIFLLDPLYRAYMNQRRFLIGLGVAMTALLVALLWVGTSRFGLVGAISAVVICRVIERTIAAIRFGSILGVGRKDLALLKDVGKLALSAAVAALATAGVRLLLLPSKPIVILAVCGVVFCLLYLCGILLAGILTADEKDLARRKIAILLPPLRLATK